VLPYRCIVLAMHGFQPLLELKTFKIPLVSLCPLIPTPSGRGEERVPPCPPSLLLPLTPHSSLLIRVATTPLALRLLPMQSCTWEGYINGRNYIKVYVERVKVKTSSPFQTAR
ncbi:hypothetical protein, partial [Chroococcidiopsis cubana]|uniref:hypothetical protein n=1 Tax=Chroococcidiopsis cubana TaxID=171392 RepID=UPI001C62E0C2